MLRSLSLVLALFAAPACWATVAMPNLITVLDAHFDDKPLGQPIGTGGAAQGEPILTTAGLSTEIVASSPGRSLALTSTNTANAQRASFELLGSEEVTEGWVRIELQLQPTTLSNYQVTVREQGGAASSFLSLTLAPSGQIRAGWAANSTGVVIGNYSAGSSLGLSVDFDMDTDRFTIRLDGTPVLVDQAHGVSTGRGIGRVSVGFGSSAANGGPLRLDWLKVQRSAPLEAVLAADFDNKPLGQPIALGGAELGEPRSVDSNRMQALVIAADPGRALRLTRLNTPSNTSAASLRFEFIDAAEIVRGPLRIDVLLTFEQLGSYALRTRESAGGSAVRWLDLEFTSTGQIRRQVRSLASGVVGSYAAGVPLQLTLLGDFDARVYRVLLNGAEIDAGSFDANARGVGALMFTFLSGSAGFDTSFVVDDILVQAAPVRVFSDGFE